MKRRELTEHQNECADRLKAIWLREKKARGLTQEDAKLALNFDSQSAVSHYLNKQRPLNTDSKIKFANFLRCRITEIDPTFTELDSLTPAEREWIDALRALPPSFQDKLIDLAKSAILMK